MRKLYIRLCVRLIIRILETARLAIHYLTLLYSTLAPLDLHALPYPLPNLSVLDPYSTWPLYTVDRRPLRTLLYQAVDVTVTWKGTLYAASLLHLSFEYFPQPEAFASSASLRSFIFSYESYCTHFVWPEHIPRRTSKGPERGGVRAHPERIGD